LQLSLETNKILYFTGTDKKRRYRRSDDIADVVIAELKSTLTSGSQLVVRIPLVVREGLQGGMLMGLLFVFLHKKYIHTYRFYLSGSVIKFLNFCVANVSWFLKIAIIISHSHFDHVAFASILIFQTLNRMIFGT